MQWSGEHQGHDLPDLLEMSREDPTKAERIAAARARSLRKAEKRRHPPLTPQPGDEPLPWLEGETPSED